MDTKPKQNTPARNSEPTVAGQSPTTQSRSSASKRKKPTLKPSLKLRRTGAYGTSAQFTAHPNKQRRTGAYSTSAHLIIDPYKQEKTNESKWKIRPSR